MSSPGSITCPLPGEPAFAGETRISSMESDNINRSHHSTCGASINRFEFGRQTIKAPGGELLTTSPFASRNVSNECTMPVKFWCLHFVSVSAIEGI